MLNDSWDVIIRVVHMANIKQLYVILNATVVITMCYTFHLELY